MKYLIRQISGLFIRLKNAVSNAFRKKPDLSQDLEDFISEFIMPSDIESKLSYLLKCKKLDRFDVYDLMKTVQTLSQSIPQEKSIYTAVVTTSSEMSVDLDQLIDSIYYYSGVISSFKTQGSFSVDKRIAVHDRESMNRIKALKKSIHDNEAMISQLREANRRDAQEISDVDKRNKEYAKYLLKIKDVIQTISNDRLKDLSDQKSKCLKYLR